MGYVSWDDAVAPPKPRPHERLKGGQVGPKLASILRRPASPAGRFSLGRFHRAGWSQI